MAQAPQASLVEAAAAALDRHDWRAAFDGLSAANAQGPLRPSELELLAQAAWWTGQLPVAIDARERAYAVATRAGDVEGAATAAIGLGRDNLMRMSTSVSAGWINRAERLLEGVEENVGHGWLAAVRSFYASLIGNNDEALAQATRAFEIGVRLGERDLATFGMSERAVALLARGDMEEGLRLADEATLTAVSGELSADTAGGVCCATIEAASGIGDLRRASEWTDAQDRWCRREGINGFPGMCRVYRSEIKALRGAWPEAEAEARVASDELRGFVPAGAGMALYQIGEIRLRRGDLPAAEEALLGAHGFGQSTEPALSLLRLAQGKVEVAAESIKLALDEPERAPSWLAPPGTDLSRLRLLPAQVEITLAAGDVATARAAADELASLAQRFGTLPARANAQVALGAVALAEGDPTAAAGHLREAVALWSEVEAPYEVARARVILADAYRAEGAHDRAAVEVRTARDAFERLGATLDLRRAESALTDETPMGTTTLRMVRAFMFTDIVDSTRLTEELGDEAWDRLIRRHDQTVRAAAAEQGGEEVKARGDGFFLAFADPDQAIEAAVSIQRRLAAQQEGQEVVLAVRIGIHQAEANRVGLDYVGMGVNQASRIGDAADGGEILVSAATLDAARKAFSTSGRRTVELKGLSAPVEVVSIAWR
jgi:class 3 adenylate cyclase